MIETQHNEQYVFWGVTPLVKILLVFVSFSQNYLWFHKTFDGFAISTSRRFFVVIHLMSMG